MASTKSFGRRGMATRTIVTRPKRRAQIELSSCGMADLSGDDYQRLLEFRDGLRRFLRWSEDQAAAAGLTPAQHQLLLAVRGHAGAGDPTIGDVADHLLLRHHSVVGLVNRAEAAGLVTRWADADDQRVVR